MANSGPTTENVDLAAVDTHGTSVDLTEEPSYGAAVGTSPAAPVTKTAVKTKKVVKEPEEPKDDDLKTKLLAAGAIVAVGVAIVLGVRHFKGEEEPESTAHWAKRKAKDTKRAAKDAGSRGFASSKDALESAGEKLGDAAEAAQEKAQEAADAAVEKTQARELQEEAQKKQEEARKRVEAEVNEADKRAASPAAELEQRRMTYGQDEHGKPKGLTKDAGFLGFKNWWPGAKKA